MKRVFSHYILATLLVMFACQTLAAVGERAERDPRDFSSGLGWGTSREEILGNRERRKRQLRNLVNSLRKQLADHSAGEITLDPQKKTDIERRIDIFGRKLNMLDREPDDMEIERIIAQSTSQRKRRDETRQSILSEATGTEL